MSKDWKTSDYGALPDSGETHVYDTHDNGARVYHIEVIPSTHIVRIASRNPCEDDDHPEEPDYCDKHPTFTPRFEYVYKHVWIGKDPEYVPMADGNSVLLQLPDNRMIFVGAYIISFALAPNDEIVSYHSPLGNSDVPMPYAVGRTHTYLFAEHLFINNRDRDMDKDPYYDEYYKSNDYHMTSKKDRRRQKKKGRKRRYLPLLNQETIAEREGFEQSWIGRWAQAMATSNAKNEEEKKVNVRTGGGQVTEIQFDEQPALSSALVDTLAARYTKEEPQLFGPTEEERRRMVVLLYDLDTGLSKLYMHWFRMCGQDILPYQPMSPPAGSTHRYRMEFYIVPKDCSIDLQQAFTQLADLSSGRQDLWVQSLIDYSNQGRYEWKRFAPSISFRAFTPRPPLKLPPVRRSKLTAGSNGYKPPHRRRVGTIPHSARSGHDQHHSGRLLWGVRASQRLFASPPKTSSLKR